MGMIAPGEKERVQFYCGGHPYLLEMLGYEIVELFREEQKIDVDRAAHRIMQSFLDQYDRMVDLLREAGSLHKLLQMAHNRNGVLQDYERKIAEGYCNEIQEKAHL